MDIESWNMLFYASLLGLGLGLVLLFLCRFLKRIPFQPYKEDDFIKEKKTRRTISRVYFTHGETRKYIMRYVICKNESEKYVICNYNRKYETIKFFVVCYGFRKRIVSVYQYHEHNTTGSASKIIPVSFKTRRINIIIAKVDDTMINNSVFHQIKKRNIRLFSFVSAFSILCALFAIRHIVARLMCREYFYSFLNSQYNLISIIAIGGISLLYCLFTMLVLSRKNAKVAVGGVVEYEFV